MKRASRPYGSPQNDEWAQKSNVVFTASTVSADYAALRRIEPEKKIYYFAELGTTPENPYSGDSYLGTVLTLMENHNLEFHPTAMVGNSRVVWWQPHLEDEYDAFLTACGEALRACDTPDLQACDGIEIDSAMWTYPNIRTLLGVEIPGRELDDWIRDRCRAFMAGYDAGGLKHRLSIGTKGWGEDDSRSLPYDIFDSAGGEGESFWTLREGGRRGTGVVKLWSFLRGVLRFFAQNNDPDPFFVFNVSVLNWDKRETAQFLTAAACVYRWLELHGERFGVPVYWMCDKNMWGHPFDDTEYPRAHAMFKKELVAPLYTDVELQDDNFIYKVVPWQDSLKIERRARPE